MLIQKLAWFGPPQADKGITFERPAEALGRRDLVCLGVLHYPLELSIFPRTVDEL